MRFNCLLGMTVFLHNNNVYDKSKVKFVRRQNLTVRIIKQIIKFPNFISILGPRLR